MSVVLIDYGSGNLNSAEKAFQRASGESGRDLPVVVTADPDRVRKAERIVLPGVGAFADCMSGLAAVPGMIDVLTEAVQDRGKPFLGICVGMQLLASRGHEHGEAEGLGWIVGDVRMIAPGDPQLKVPHMGWNTLEARRPHPLLSGIPTGSDGLHAYFVHSYQLEPADQDNVVAESDYAGPITAVVAKNNVAGTQFHPEKSQVLGLKLIANFLAWSP